MKQRDLRLDFFRGLALAIIYINHIPFNWLSQYTPSRFGPSDAAEIFIFLSGYAAWLAYGRTFQKSGFWLGSSRIVLRCGQLYSAHLSIFFILALICVIGNHLVGDIDYVGQLNLWPFFENTDTALLGLFTLTYVPNYFDILPMYIVCLALLPVFILMAAIRPLLALLVSAGLYTLSWLYGWNLPADITSERSWFFNPLAWQLLFFSGFAFSAGWLKPPPRSLLLVIFCCVVVMLGAWISYYPFYSSFEGIFALHLLTRPYVDKSAFGFLRLLHFLALAYLAVILLHDRKAVLGQRWAAPFIRAGQHSLPVFMFSLALSYMAGMVLDQIGREPLQSILVSTGGIGLLFCSAYILVWFKSKPWQISAAQTDSSRATTVSLAIAENRSQAAVPEPDIHQSAFHSPAD
jgi:hypothetical protein